MILKHRAWPRSVSEAFKMGLEPLGCGKDRHTFALPGGRNVIKYPRCTEGMDANYDEAALFRIYGQKGHPKIGLARCRLIPGTSILVMEVVERAEWKSGLPSWCAWIDGGQVGYTRRGVLVAYDYADEAHVLNEPRAEDA